MAETVAPCAERRFRFASCEGPIQPMHSLIDALGDIPVITQPQRVRQRSRDFYWYSPILRERLAEVTADLVVCPRDEADVIRALAACHSRQVPVTPRGAGTGNYGQAMPLEGGVVLDLSAMNRVLAIGLGRVRAQAGAVLADIDRACQADSRQELRFHPSTWATATLGGFVAGGSSGVGSIGWGLLRDAGNILGLRVVTMEAEPRVLELRGEDIQKVNHAYGTTGVITEVEMPLAPAYPWHEAIVAWPDLMAACRFAQRLAEQDGLVKKLVTVVGQPIAHQYFPAFEGIVPPDRDLVLAMIADPARDAFMALVRAEGGALAYHVAPDGRRPKGVLPLFEYSWNHTTLHALKQDRAITYLQTLFPPPDHLALVETMAARFGDEVPMHLEFVRFGGRIACFGLQLVRYSTAERLAEIIAAHEAAGCPIFNPHAFTLEEGGMKQVDAVQLAFKREADPDGLLNPGKMRAWHEPDYVGGARPFHLYPSVAGARSDDDPR